MTDMRVTVQKDNTKQFTAAMDAALARAMEEVGLVAEGYAKAKCPVDTGMLRNSITHIGGKEGNAHVEAIGTNVEYAKYVELGTSRAKEQPYLRPAAEDHANTYQQIIRANLGGA